MGIMSDGSEASKLINVTAISFTGICFVSAFVCQQEHKFSSNDGIQ
jgi:hypothetical protein